MARPEGIFARPPATEGLTWHAGPRSAGRCALPRQPPAAPPRPFALVAGAVLYVVTLRLSSYNDYQVGEIAAYVVALVGLSLLTGVNGQISLGHGAFMAVGAYTMALLMNHTAGQLRPRAGGGDRRGRGGRAW